MSTDELGEVKTRSNKDSQNKLDCGELFNPMELKEWTQELMEVLWSEDNNKDIKSTIEEVSVKSAIGRKSMKQLNYGLWFSEYLLSFNVFLNI